MSLLTPSSLADDVDRLPQVVEVAHHAGEASTPRALRPVSVKCASSRRLDVVALFHGAGEALLVVGGEQADLTDLAQVHADRVVDAFFEFGFRGFVLGLFVLAAAGRPLFDGDGLARSDTAARGVVVRPRCRARARRLRRRRRHRRRRVGGVFGRGVVGDVLHEVIGELAAALSALCEVSLRLLYSTIYRNLDGRRPVFPPSAVQLSPDLHITQQKLPAIASSMVAGAPGRSTVAGRGCHLLLQIGDLSCYRLLFRL